MVSAHGLIYLFHLQKRENEVIVKPVSMQLIFLVSQT